ncbi:MAG TPA: MFS transporter [Gaiellaceae bacterium]|nr:MFS transporter [Gaiellaceae bacterium]
MRRPSGALWSHPDFVKLWTGQSISELGSQVSQLAIPWLAAVDLHASPLAFSLLGVLGFLPFILFALPAGVWVDRLRRRQILIVGDSARAVLLLLIPVLWFAGVLEIWHLLVLEFVIGVFTVFFDVAYQSYLPALIEREHLVDGNSKLQVTVGIAQVGGPSLAGGLIAAITAPYAILVDSMSFVISSVFMIRMRHRENLPRQDTNEPRPRMWPQVKEGLAWVVGHRNLRAIAGCTGTSNFCSSLMFAIVILYMVRVLHLSAFEAGAVFAVGSAGSIVGALFANRLGLKLGLGTAIVFTAVIFSFGGLAYPLAPKSFPLPALMAGQLLFGFSAIAYNILQVSYRQAITPERLQGRMNAAMRWIVWGTIPLGTLAGGAIAQATTLHTALWVGALLGTPTFLWVLLSPLRSIREIPQPVDALTPAQAELAGGLVEGGPLAEPSAADA